jgi:hypothetical protein
MRNSKFLSLIVIPALLFLTLSAHAAYLSLGESGEIIPEGTYQVGVAPQFLTNNDGGFNIAAFLDVAWLDSFSSRFLVGAGATDFFLSGSAKFVPFPDVDRQPAIGIKAAVWYARDGSQNINTLQLAPMISKHYQTDYGMIVPYAAYGISTYSVGGEDKTGQQFFVGSDWKSPDLPSVNFTGEFAFSLKDSTSSITFFASLPFDDKKGFGK